MKNIESGNFSIDNSGNDRKSGFKNEGLTGKSGNKFLENISSPTFFSSSKNNPKQKIRIDELVHKLNPEISLEKCKKLIMAGQIRSDSQPVDKPGTRVKQSACVEIIGIKKYVSRAGYKLEGAWKEINFSIKGKIALDIGISTGGFTDFLLQKNIFHVIGVDVGQGITDNKIRNNERCTLLEKTNARNLTLETVRPITKHLGREIDLVLMDVSFISVLKIIPALIKCVSKTAEFVIMVKPQFEIEKHRVPNGGVLSASDSEDVFKTMRQRFVSFGFEIKGEGNAGIKGTKGNQERFYWMEMK
ncbi:TlyA family RNA methyltransferase [bacterium]|jgi:23S rRNA (cytidine1920-2'-O)/16S rRNA (cytidine1409-2'-O)-methyltransferase|nr:TlyA family RNA methyltransferase [bacterium]